MIQDAYGQLVSHAMPGQTTADCLTCLICTLKGQLREVREQLRRFQVRIQFKKSPVASYCNRE